MKKIASFLPLVVLLALASCATTAGTAFRQVLDSSPPPREGSSSVEVQPADTKPEQTGLEVQTTPSDAQVYLNDTFIGDTPLIYTAFRAGTYRITISKRGYYDSVRWLNLDPTAYTLVQTDLSPKVGYLSISTSTANAEITVDGNGVGPGVEPVPVGTHRIRIRAFGFEDWSETVEVYENQTVTVNAVLTKAPFRISGLSESRTVLNPLNPGRLGQVVFSFEVSTHGVGNLVVMSSDGRSVFQYQFPQFNDREQSYRWDGRATDGKPLPDGNYRITVSGRESTASAASTRSLSLEINRGSYIGLRSQLSGVSGLLFAGTPEVLPISSYSISSLAIAHLDSTGALVPVQVAVRAVPHAGVEIDGQAAVELKSSNSIPVSGGLAGKFLLTNPKSPYGFSAAITVKGTYVSLTASDILTNFTGLSLGFPFEYRIGPVGFVFMPDLIAAPYPASYTSAPPIFLPTFWGYGRGGMFLDFGSLVTGGSVALRTQPFSQGLGFSTRLLDAGWEIHWLIPNTQLVLSCAATIEYSPDPTIGFFGMAGAGLGFVN